MIDDMTAVVEGRHMHEYIIPGIHVREKKKRHTITHLSVQTAETWCRMCRLASMLYVLTKGGTETHL